MKKFIYALTAFALLIGFTSCNDSEDANKSTYLSTETLTTFAHRSVNIVNVHTEDSWIATTDVPWIQISPANGLRSAECKVIVDSTTIQNERDARIRFTFSSGETRFIKVEQSGYLPTISLEDSVMRIDNYGSINDRYFDINILSNVKFDIKMQSIDEDGSVSWLNSEPVNFNFDRGARPRNINVRFRWNNNNIPFNDRKILVKFDPIEDIDCQFDRKDSLLVIQKAGELIEDSRAGDSLAVLGIMRSLGCWYISDPSESFSKWSEVDLWKPSDEGYTKEREGRVRKLAFRFFTTLESIPYEFRYLKYMETLSIFSNTNYDQLDIKSGDALSNLQYLKRLTLYAYGLTSLDESFVNLRNLEYLDLSGNNFKEIPRMINKENFPNLKVVDFVANKLNNTLIDNIRFFTWDKLEVLALGVNEIHGSIPTEKEISDYYLLENGVEMPRYTLDDCVAENLPTEQVGKLKIIPNVEELRLNLNRLTGDLPEWLLYHPRLYDWNVYPLVFNQEGRDPSGKIAGFDNEPFNLNYYYEYYKDKYPTN